jgi:hypothetical protein
LRHPVLPEQDVIDSGTDLLCARVGTYLSDARSQARHSNSPYAGGDLLSGECTGREFAMRCQHKYGPRGQVGIHRFTEVHRYTHGRRGNQEWDLVVTGLDDVRVTDDKLAVMMVKYLAPEPRLKISAEVIKVESINAAVHETVAVGGAYNGIAFQIED